MKVFRLFFAAMLVLHLSIAPVLADEDVITEIKQQMDSLKRDYESRIKYLEEKVEKLESKQVKVEKEQTMKVAQLEEKLEKKGPEVEYVGRHNAPVGKGGLVLKNPFGFGDVSLGGYFDHEYHDFEGGESTFRQHRWIVNIGAQPHERIRFNSELEIEYGGPDTSGSDGEIKVEQAYADFLINDLVNFRGGIVLAPMGRYNIYHDSDLQDLTDRPLVARDVIPTTWSESGIGLFGEFNPQIGDYEDLLLNYEVYVVNGLDAGFTDNGLGGGKGSLKTDNNDNKAVVGRLTASPAIGQEASVSGYWGEYGASDDAITGIAVDTLNNIGPLELITEYAYFDVDESNAATDLANYFQGAYVQANYHFWPEFLDDSFLGRKFDNPNFTLVGRYDWVKISDDGDANVGTNEETRWTLGMNYRPIENFVMKFEYQWNETDNEGLEHGNSNGFLTSIALGF